MNSAVLVGDRGAGVIGPGVPPDVARSVVVVTIAVTGAAAIGLVPTVVSAVIAAVVVAVIGIPHGSVDHLVSERLAVTPPSRAVFVGRYLAAMVCVGAVWAVAPTIAFVAFLAMSVHHFGQSDLARLGVGHRGPRLVLFWSRGLVLVAVPLVAHLDLVAPTIRTLTGRDPTDLGLLTDGRWPIVAVLVAAHLVTIVLVVDRPARLSEITATLVLGALFVVADPLLGFAVYFGLWHSLGHVYVIADRLGIVDRPLRSVARLAIPLSAVSLAGLAGMSVALLGFGRDDLIVPAAIVAVSMLTLPHMAVVEQMWSDRAEALSRPARRGPERTRT